MSAASRAIVSRPSTVKRHGSVRWWFGAKTASSSSSRTSAGSTGSSVKAFSVRRSRIASSTSIGGSVADGRRQARQYPTRTMRVKRRRRSQ